MKLAALLALTLVAGCGDSRADTTRSDSDVPAPSATAGASGPDPVASEDAGQQALVAEIASDAIPLDGTDEDYDRLLALIGDARIVMLGEATHGTHEFYRERAEITLRLVEEKGFDAVAIEGDWARVRPVYEYVLGESAHADADAALAAFDDFPRWMWRNAEFAAFIEALKEHNAITPSRSAGRVGVYGLDLYAPELSAAAVIAHLETTDAASAAEARDRYACVLEPNSRSRADADSCAAEAQEQLDELTPASVQTAAQPMADAAFDAIQNARVVLNAQRYALANEKWNTRDGHMMQTLEAILEHLESRTDEPRLVLWAHNSHVGDATATELGERGQLTVGGLVQQRYGEDAVGVGFTTYSGEVLAASAWGQDAVLQQVRPALDGSYEKLFHDVATSGSDNFMLRLDRPPLAEALGVARLERAIGVVYLPATERSSHYFEAKLSAQFDVVLHFDRTHAVEPLGPPQAGSE